MRRASLLSAALIYLSTSLVIIGCDKSAVPEQKSEKPIPPPIEIKTKQDNKSKLVKEDVDSLPPPVRQK
jgi:hypothetical protein